MDLTSAEKAAQQATLADARSAFNASIATPLTALAKALKAAKQTPEIQSTIIAFNVPATALNVAGQQLLRAIAATDALVPTDPQPTVEPAFIKGYFDSCSPAGVCVGWASKSGSLVHILVDNVEVGTVRATLPRPDVAASGINNGPNTGWTFQLPALITTNVAHTVKAHVGGVFLGGQGIYGSAPILPAGPWTRFTNALSSDAEIQRDFWHANAFYGTSPTINRPSVWIDGMLEIPIQQPLNSNPGEGGTGCSWHHTIAAPQDELYLEYEFTVTLDVAAGMNEIGVKLPGFGGGPDSAPDGEWFSARMWHGRRDANGDYPLACYIYSAQQHETNVSGGYADIAMSTGKLHEGTRHKIGQHIKLNTPGIADGTLELLLDGVSVYRDDKYKFRTNGVRIDDLFFNVFHGGHDPVLQRITFRAANVVIDNKPISSVVPPSGKPAWLAGRAPNVWGEIPNTTFTEASGTMADGSYSGSTNDLVNATMSSVGAAGHAVSDDNGVYRIDLKADAPKWSTLRASDGALTGDGRQVYWPNGRPTGAHIYNSGQARIVNGKPIYIRAVNAAAAATGLTTESRTDVFDPERGDWVLGGYAGPPRTYQEHSCATDPDTGFIWLADQGGLLAYLDLGMMWHVVRTSANPFPNAGWRGMVVHKGCIYTGINRDFIQSYNIDTGVIRNVPLAWVGTAVGWGKPARTMTIDRARGVIYTVDSLRPPADNPDGEVVDGSPCFLNKIDLAAGTITNIGQVDQPTRMYNRLEYFPTLGGLVHWMHAAVNVRFMPVG